MNTCPRSLKILVLFAACAVLAATAMGAVPQMLHIQGRAIDSDGQNHQGNAGFKFVLGDFSENPPVVYWSNDGSSTPSQLEPNLNVELDCDNGHFSVFLGNAGIGMVPVPSSVFSTDRVFLRVWFEETPGGGHQVLTPDERIVPVGYAMVADRIADGGVNTPMLADNAVTSAKIENGSITADDLGPLSVGSTELMNGSVGAGHIADGSITLADIGQNGATPGQVMKWTSAESGPGYWRVANDVGITDVGSAEIVDGSISLVDIGLNGASEGKILKFLSGVWAIANDETGSGGTTLKGYAENGDFDPAPVASGNNSIAMGAATEAQGTACVIGGGWDSTIYSGADMSIISGGLWNVISNSSTKCTISGGELNIIENQVHLSTLGGGSANRIAYMASSATLCGGYHNEISTNAKSSTIGGGNTTTSEPTRRMLQSLGDITIASAPTAPMQPCWAGAKILRRVMPAWRLGGRRSRQITAPLFGRTTRMPMWVRGAPTP